MTKICKVCGARKKTLSMYCQAMPDMNVENMSGVREELAKEAQ